MYYIEILVLFLLILLNGIFSMSEIALVSAKKFKLENLATKGSANAKKVIPPAQKTKHIFIHRTDWHYLTRHLDR